MLLLQCVFRKPFSRTVLLPWIYLTFFSDAGQVTIQIVRFLWVVLAWKRGEGNRSGRRGCLSIHRSLPWVWISSRAFQRRGLMSLRKHCSVLTGLASSNDWCTIAAHNTEAKSPRASPPPPTNSFLFRLCLCLSLILTRRTFCQEAVSPFALWSAWYEHLIAQFSPTVANGLLLGVHVAEQHEEWFSSSAKKADHFSCEFHKSVLYCVLIKNL